MNEMLQFNDWRENLLHNFRGITTDEDLGKLALCYPDNKSDKEKCRQRKNNLLRRDNRNIYLDDLYAVSCYTKKSPDCLLLGENNIASLWNGLKGENLFDSVTIEKITGSLKSDKSYRDIFIPEKMQDFLYYAKATVYSLNKKKIGEPIFSLSDNSLEFITQGKAEYSYTANLFNGSFVYDVFCDYILDFESEDFPGCERDSFEMFRDTLNVYLDCGECVVGIEEKNIEKRIKNWVCNCTIWLVLSYIGDTCKRLSQDIEGYLEENKEIVEFAYKLFVFGTKTILQKRVTDEITKEKKRIRYAAYLDCNDEKLVAESEYIDYYDDIEGVETASFSDMQKASLDLILNYEYR
ncbi:MAG: hypothetical protein IKC01_04135 [Clostridia bacterium]|nr:hypothetical protein [Clostridia bacterium]